jgi:signal peptidase I
MTVRIVRRTLTLTLVAFVLVVAGTALAIQLAPAFGHRLYAIRSGSMEPGLGVGDVVLVRETDGAAVGDILTYRLPNGAVVTHRVLEIGARDGEATFSTKGDANPTADAAPVPAAWVIGIVAGQIPLLGFLVALIAMPIGIVSVLSIAGTLITAIWLLDEYAEAPPDALHAPPWPSDNPDRRPIS